MNLIKLIYLYKKKEHFGQANYKFEIPLPCVFVNKYTQYEMFNTAKEAKEFVKIESPSPRKEISKQPLQSSISPRARGPTPICSKMRGPGHSALKIGVRGTFCARPMLFYTWLF